MERRCCGNQRLKYFLLLQIIFLVSSLYFMSTYTSFTVYMKGLPLFFIQFFSANSTTNIDATQLLFTTENAMHTAKNGLVNLPFKHYLVPVTSTLHNETLFNDSLSEHILRNAIGLQPYTTENKEEIWIENGVQYRPFPYLEKAHNPYYTSEFEAYVPFNKTLFFEGDEKKASVDISEKKIILWWQHKIHHGQISGLNLLRACPDFPCVLTSEEKYTSNSSAMLVNAQFVKNKRPPVRRSDQVLIHYQIEAPFNYWFYGHLFYKDLGWNDVFNWTMSYRMDSDIITYHGIVRRRREVKQKNYTAILEKKKSLVVWMVSSCSTNSKREKYVKELQKYIPVDIYGTCGPFKCPRDRDKKCFKQIEEKYKFYLSFENNICKDYITEKLFKYLNSDFIVIARGYNTYSRHLPSEIYLNTANFKSPKALAEKLMYLNTNDQQYIEMLKEKDKYSAIYEDYPLTNINPNFIEHRFEAVPMCKLCQRLWNLEKYSKVEKNMAEWFHKPEFQCHSPSDM